MNEKRYGSLCKVECDEVMEILKVLEKLGVTTHSFLQLHDNEELAKEVAEILTEETVNEEIDDRLGPTY